MQSSMYAREPAGTTMASGSESLKRPPDESTSAYELSTYNVLVGAIMLCLVQPIFLVQEGKRLMGHQPIASQTRMQRIEKGVGGAVNIATNAAGLVGTARTLWHAGSAFARVAGPMVGALL